MDDLENAELKSVDSIESAFDDLYQLWIEESRVARIGTDYTRAQEGKDPTVLESTNETATGLISQTLKEAYDTPGTIEFAERRSAGSVDARGHSLKGTYNHESGDFQVTVISLWTKINSYDPSKKQESRNSSHI